MILALAACTGAPEGEAPESGLTYTGSSRAILDEHCATCHHAGGNTPFPLTTYDEVAPLAPLIAEAVESGRMPPWPPDPSCREYLDDRTMPLEDAMTLVAWAQDGAPEGEPDDQPPFVPPPSTLEDYTDAARVQGYVPPLDAGDHYRCFVLDLDLATDRYVTATSITPGSPPVHHVLVYAFSGDQKAMIEEADAADPGEGYACGASPLPLEEAESSLASGMAAFAGGFPNQLAGWAPGSTPAELDEGYGIRVDGGSLVMMQVHYSAVGGEAVPDETELRLRLTDEMPDKLLKTTALLVYDLYIPAGANPISFTDDTPYYGTKPLELQAFAGHMHMLGTRVAGRRYGADGADECLLDIPAWDFEWQGAYTPVEPVTVGNGDRLRLTCEYDNSAENQPVVDGVQQVPQDVTFGEDTLDEMCLLYLVRVEDAVASAPTETPCGAAAACVDACEGSWACTSGCIEKEPACASCVAEAVPSCAPLCTLTLAADVECAEDCFMGSALLGGSVSMCLAAECPEVGASFDACMDDVLTAGACAESFTACGF